VELALAAGAGLLDEAVEGVVGDGNLLQCRPKRHGVRNWDDCDDSPFTASYVDTRRRIRMEHMIQLHIEKLPEGVYLATSDDVQGLLAQGRTLQETVEIARDVAKKLIESQSDPIGTTLPPLRESFDYPLIVAV
jgi:predicted RNase H-like HicB family nuclease